ncbi:MAG: hypothetical protein CRN43_10185, partial [Candidatus Nephrothrix sp. EaCA]
PPPPPRTGSRLAKEGGIAANGTPQEPLINKTSSPQLLTLSDGTKITLEQESALTVVAFTQSVRQVRLQGKAFFEADNIQRPFYRYAENLAIQAQDACFTVNTSRAARRVKIIFDPNKLPSCLPMVNKKVGSAAAWPALKVFRTSSGLMRNVFVQLFFLQKLLKL